MAEGVSFAGDGSMGLGINVNNTGNSDYGRSEQKEIEFAGKGGDDVNHSFTTNNGSKSIPSGGQIEFVGDN